MRSRKRTAYYHDLRKRRCSGGRSTLSHLFVVRAMHVLVYAYGYSYVPMFIQTCAVVQIHTKTRTCKHTPCIHHAQRRESDLEPFWEAYQNAVKAGAIKSRDMAPDMHRWLSRNVQALPPPGDPPLHCFPAAWLPSCSASLLPSMASAFAPA